MPSERAPALSALGLWRHIAWPVWRAQPARILLALLAVMLGVALAFGVHLLNGAALTEFSRAARGVNGQADLILRARDGALTDSDLAEVLNLPGVANANPVLEAEALWLGQGGPAGGTGEGGQEGMLGQGKLRHGRSSRRADGPRRRGVRATVGADPCGRRAGRVMVDRGGPERARRCAVVTRGAVGVGRRAAGRGGAGHRAARRRGPGHGAPGAAGRRGASSLLRPRGPPEDPGAAVG